jgi:hypothetical protein
MATILDTGVNEQQQPSLAGTGTDFGMRAGDAAKDDLALMKVADELLRPVNGRRQVDL